jgi:serine/threonine protein kinase, bacterial
MELLQTGVEPIPGHRLLRRLGAGGFGEVWAAAGPEGRTVALKFLFSGADRAAQEVRSLQAIRHLEHPHLIKIEQVWCLATCIVIAMELADGSLADLFEVYRHDYSVSIPPEHCCHYLTQAAMALDFLNTRQHVVNGVRVAVQHCDVKPSNLLLFSGTVKVADFGLSGCISTGTKVFRRAGTMGYCAPEVFKGLLSLHSDQYSLAVTYCHLRCGILPIRDDPSTIRADYVRPAPDLSKLSPREQPILARALDPVPYLRWPSCGAFMEHLTKAIR